MELNIRKVASPHVQVALQPHESKKLNLVVPEKSCDFSYTITKGCLNIKAAFFGLIDKNFYNYYLSSNSESKVSLISNKLSNLFIFLYMKVPKRFIL